MNDICYIFYYYFSSNVKLQEGTIDKIFRMFQNIFQKVHDSIEAS